MTKKTIVAIDLISEQCRQFFLQNPVMFSYATRLLWGICENERLVGTFICSEDTSLLNTNNDEMNIDTGSVLGLKPRMRG